MGWLDRFLGILSDFSLPQKAFLWQQFSVECHVRVNGVYENLEHRAHPQPTKRTKTEKYETQISLHLPLGEHSIMENNNYAISLNLCIFNLETCHDSAPTEIPSYY